MSAVLAGLTEFLENESGVRDVKISHGAPVSMEEVVVWEKQHKCSLPDDLRQFFSTNNGLSLQWSYQCNIGTVVQLGRVQVNSLFDLRPLHLKKTSSSNVPSQQPSLLDFDLDPDLGYKLAGEGAWQPSLGEACKVFSLDYCCTSGHICLVHNELEEADHEWGGVWLLDLSLTWHYLSPCFSDYLRLAVIHLGLLQWPYSLTPYGLSPHYEKWFHMFAMKRLEMDRKYALSQQSSDHAHSMAGTIRTRQMTRSHVLQSSPFKNHLEISKVLYSGALKDKMYKSRHQAK